MAIPTTTLPDGGAMPRVGLGTWHMGESRARASAEAAAIRHAIDRGITLIDTAEMYGEGGAESVIGEAIRGRRQGLFLVSKVYPHNAGRRAAVEACERSLRRLGVERIDLYLLHWRGSVPLGETIEAFEMLAGAGKIARWGVSNFGRDDMEELLAAGGSGVAANQVLYNLGRRGIEWDLLGWQRERGIPLMAYTPLEQGRLASHRALADVAHRHGAAPLQVALAWVLREPGVVAIPKSAKPDHIDENLGALDLALTDDDLAALDAAFPPPTRARPLEML